MRVCREPAGTFSLFHKPGTKSEGSCRRRITRDPGARHIRLMVSSCRLKTLASPVCFPHGYLGPHALSPQICFHQTHLPLVGSAFRTPSPSGGPTSAFGPQPSPGSSPYRRLALPPEAERDLPLPWQMKPRTRHTLVGGALVLGPSIFWKGWVGNHPGCQSQPG